MRKLRLTLEELRIDSFATEAPGAARGTVRGRDGTEYTICWGLCGGGGGESDCDLSCGPESEGCTNDPRAPGCISYAVQCPATQYPNSTCVDTCVDAQGYTMCGEVCW